MNILAPMLRILLVMIILIPVYASAQPGSIDSLIRKEIGLGISDTLVITPIELRSSKEIFFYNIKYTKQEDGITKGNTFALFMNNKLYIKNKTNSWETGEVYTKEIYPYLKSKLRKRDRKKVDEYFVIHVYPANF
jgi:hypothetical protein